ncbi:hypothetical protein L210DRAFT_3654956 [Boletus edulis BED1]|uniref:Uncharacterized protein n=1 Tax=Boletus edulis BED1 TaxID=1328754 RepID=A0AAD4G7C4_BOLED|nr:hypothetical protein L210DRAFT_3654956 [Boletus edulis BED1]
MEGPSKNGPGLMAKGKRKASDDDGVAKKRARRAPRSLEDSLEESDVAWRAAKIFPLPVEKAANLSSPSGAHGENVCDDEEATANSSGTVMAVKVPSVQLSLPDHIAAPMDNQQNTAPSARHSVEPQGAFPTAVVAMDTSRTLPLSQEPAVPHAATSSVPHGPLFDTSPIPVDSMLTQDQSHQQPSQRPKPRLVTKANTPQDMNNIDDDAFSLRHRFLKHRAMSQNSVANPSTLHLQTTKEGRAGCGEGQLQDTTASVAPDGGQEITSVMSECVVFPRQIPAAQALPQVASDIPQEAQDQRAVPAATVGRVDTVPGQQHSGRGGYGEPMLMGGGWYGPSYPGYPGAFPPMAGPYAPWTPYADVENAHTRNMGNGPAYNMGGYYYRGQLPPPPPQYMAAQNMHGQHGPLMNGRFPPALLQGSAPESDMPSVSAEQRRNGGADNTGRSG